MARRKKAEANGDTVVEHPLDVTSAPPEAEDTGEQPNRPVHQVRFGLVKASIWLTQGPYGPRHHVTVNRAYKGDDGNWYHTSTFTNRDLLALAKCLDWAHSYIAEAMAGNEPPF